ncbi:ATP-binding protein [Spirosoma radiotolerans]|uniref:ATP-binding protein n=1 Tax=Spirosoma radiotolerans TaxID=1379870 RepID=UPI00069692DA|nr:ATP-binding protein [Spirosoma radiotolerans]
MPGPFKLNQPDSFPFLLNLQAEQERLRYAMQAAQVGTWHLDISQQEVWLDERSQELFGSPGKEVVAYSYLLALIYPDDQHLVDQALKTAFDPSSTGYYDVQFRIRKEPTGASRWLHCQGRAYVDVLGAAYRLSGVARDITVQVQVQQQLEASKARIRSIVLNSPTPTVLFVGRDLVIDTVNAPMLQIWGKDASVTGQSLYGVLPDLIPHPLLEQLQQVYDREEAAPHAFDNPKVVIDKQWNESWFNFSYNPVYSPEGTVFGIIHTATDVTRQVTALQELQRSELRFRALVEEAPIATCLLVGQSLVIQVANESMLAFLGTPKQLIGQPLLSVLPGLQGQPLLSRLSDILEDGQMYSAQGARADWLMNGVSSTYYIDFTAKPLSTEQGEVYAILVMATDVTERVLAQQLIQRSNEQKTIILQLADQLRNLTSLDDIYEHVARQLGVSIGADQTAVVYSVDDQPRVVLWPTPELGEKQPIEANCALILNEIDREQTRIFSDVVHDPTLTVEQKERYQRSQIGAVITKPLVLNNGSVLILFIIHRQAHQWPVAELALVEEVSERLVNAVERTQAEIELQQSEQRYRLLAEQLEQRVAERTGELALVNQDLTRSNENLQQFAYVASHDLQEPLRKIQSFSTLLADQLDPQLNTRAKDYLQRIQSAGARMSVLIRDLLSYSRIATRQQVFGSISLSVVVAEVLDTLSLVITEREAQVQLEELPLVNGDALQLGQLFQNLVSNALKFTPASQTPFIRITYSQRPQNELPQGVNPSKSASFYHQINVSDNGVGFDIKYLDRIFQVFQRLHSQSEYVGTGVGLAICQRVVENHGGAITAESAPGRGATFTVFLPQY